jgi:hypothetical protein
MQALIEVRALTENTKTWFMTGHKKITKPERDQPRLQKNPREEFVSCGE